MYMSESAHKSLHNRSFVAPFVERIAYIQVSNTNEHSIQNTLDVVIHRLVGMGLNFSRQPMLTLDAGLGNKTRGLVQHTELTSTV